MSNMLEKKFKNVDLGIELTSYLDNQQTVFFLGKDVATILGYSNTKEALKRHVSEENKMIRFMQVNCRGRETRPQQNDNRGKYYTIINEPGFYELVFGSKLEFAKKFRQWVFNTVLPSIRKYGYFKMFDNPNDKMFKIENETDLHYKVVQLIRNYYPDSLLVAGLGENQDTNEKRLDSYKKGYHEVNQI